MQDQSFIAGMFSRFGVLFGMPLAEVLAPLSMSELMHAALLEQKGELGLMLRLCESAERADFASVASHVEALQIGAAEFNHTLVEANHWMLGAIRNDQVSANG